MAFSSKWLHFPILGERALPEPISQISQNIQLRHWQKYLSIADNQRVLRRYCGVLPHQQNHALHILQCEHLRAIAGEVYGDYFEGNSIEGDYTHQIWIWYRYYYNPEELHLLFHGQLNCQLATFNPDVVAVEVTDFLAYLLSNSRNEQQFFQQGSNEQFWQQAIAHELNHIQRIGMQRHKQSVSL